MMPEAERARADAAAAALAQHVVQIQPRRAQRRHEPEHDARDERDAEREREHASVDADLVESRNLRRAELAEHFDAAIASTSPSDTAERRQQHALGEQLANDALAARADGRANRHLLLPHRGAREQKVRDVAARDEQHEPDGAEQHVQREADVADDLVDERDDADRAARR